MNTDNTQLKVAADVDISLGMKEEEGEEEEGGG